MWLQKQDPDRVSVVKEAMELQVEACMKEEDEVAAASSSDSSVEENPEDDWFGTFTQAPVERGSRNIHKTNAVKLVGTWRGRLRSTWATGPSWMRRSSPSSSSS
jgi:hypothetical protein